jgi:hypothetical protein
MRDLGHPYSLRRLPDEICAFPTIRQKNGEWMGHGAFVG